MQPQSGDYNDEEKLAQDLRGISFGLMQFFQKPVMGPVLGNQQKKKPSPVQLAFASGNFGLGLPVKSSNDDDDLDNSSDVCVVCSEPESFLIDILERRSLIFTFVVVGIFNLVITCSMYAYADTTDISRVVDSIDSNELTHVFQSVASTRRPIEQTSMFFLTFFTVLGIFSALLESALGLSAYSLYVTVNFLLGVSAIPSFVFGFRYLFDVWMLYLALVLRSKLTMTFLQLNMNQQQ